MATTFINLTTKQGKNIWIATDKISRIYSGGINQDNPTLKSSVCLVDSDYGILVEESINEILKLIKEAEKLQ